jgi:hypothetical protein
MNNCLQKSQDIVKIFSTSTDQFSALMFYGELRIFKSKAFLAIG